MIGNGSTYFHEQQCLANPHIIITGNTNDVFCGEGLIPVSLREELSMHLRRQGFDAVIYFDSSSVVYCYDTQSMAVLREGRAAPERLRSDHRGKSLRPPHPPPRPAGGGSARRSCAGQPEHGPVVYRAGVGQNRPADGG